MSHKRDRFDPEKDVILPGSAGKGRGISGQSGRRPGADSASQDAALHRRRAKAADSAKNSRHTGRSKPSGGRSRRNVSNSASRGRHIRKRRKKTSVAFKVMALIFIVLIIAAAALIIRNFGAGTKSDRDGMKAYNSGNYERAEQLFKEAVNYDRTNAQYYIHLGMTQIQKAEFDEALKTFDEAESKTRQKGEIQSARRGRGIACLYKGDYAQALDAFNSAMEFSGSKYTGQEIDILYYLAEAQEKNGDSVGSVLTYTKIIDQTGDANAYMLRGMAYQRVGDNTSAENDLYKALEMNKKNYKVYLSLYRVLEDQGKEDEAQKILKEAVGLTAKSGEDFSNQGLIYMYLGDYEKAGQSFDTALSEGYTQANFGKAESYMMQENYEEAIKCFDTYFSEFKDNALAYNQYGICLEKAGRYEEAADAFGKGIALNDRMIDAQLRFNEVNAYEKLGQWQTAYEKMQEYVAKYPEDETAAKELAFLETRQK